MCAIIRLYLQKRRRYIMEDVSLVKIDTITPDDGYDYFFAYYDLQPYDKESKIHLTHRVKFHDRIPTLRIFARSDT